MAKIDFETKLFTINDWIILKLPFSASTELPSRGQVMVSGTINGIEFSEALEPDGVGSHWFRVGKNMSDKIGVKEGDMVEVSLEISKEWLEPLVPKDIKDSLEEDPIAKSLWLDIKPVARWDWIRWIRATKNEGTRKHRIEVAFSKLKSGMKRPCCFNRTACTEMEVSHNGRLLEPLTGIKTLG